MDDALIGIDHRVEFCCVIEIFVSVLNEICVMVAQDYHSIKHSIDYVAVNMRELIPCVGL